MAEKIKIACEKDGSAPFYEEVEGEIYGAWAAHRASVGVYYKVTFIRFGLAVPYDFMDEPSSRRAAKAINSLRRDWAEVTVADIKGMSAEIIGICIRELGTVSNGPKLKGPPVPVASLPTGRTA